MVTGIAFVIALLLVTFLHVVFGEMVPKNLAFSVPDRAALMLAPPLVFVSRVFGPIIWTLNAIANGRSGCSGWSPRTRRRAPTRSTRSPTIVEQSQREGPSWTIRGR